MSIIMGMSIDVHAAMDTDPPLIVHEACYEYETGKSFRVLAKFYDDSGIFEPKVHYRSLPHPNSHHIAPWKNKPFIKNEKNQIFSATLDINSSQGELEYFIEVFDENGNGPALFGTPTSPITVLPTNNTVECIQIPSNRIISRLTESSLPPSSQGIATGPDTKNTSYFTPRMATPEEDSTITWFWVSVGTAALLIGGIGSYVFLQGTPTNTASTSPVSLRIMGPSPVESFNHLRR